MRLSQSGHRIKPSHSSLESQQADDRCRGRVLRRTFRVNISERFSPNAFTRMSTHPASGFGTGRCSILSTSGPPGSWITAAFIMAPIAACAATGFVLGVRSRDEMLSTGAVAKDVSRLPPCRRTSQM